MRNKETKLKKKVLILKNGDTVLLTGNIRSVVSDNPVVDTIEGDQIDVNEELFQEAIRNPEEFTKEFKNGRFKLTKKKKGRKDVN